MGAALLTTDIERAVDALRRGGLVAMPTETVYGLAADALDAEAVDRLYAVKGRPRDHPLILHLASADDVARFATHLSDSARRLATAFWPGPLTLLVERSDAVPDHITGGRPTVAIRVPSHPVASRLLQRFGGPLVAPSANRFGHVSATTAEHVVDDLGELLEAGRDLVLGGDDVTTVGIESTIVDCTTDVPQVLRPGAISNDDVAAIAGGTAASAGPVRAPGMLARHYAPNARLELVHDAAAAVRLAETMRTGGLRVEILDVADPVEYARTLYARLRSADTAGVAVVVAVLPPPEGLGAAIRDRLTRASAGH